MRGVWIGAAMGLVLWLAIVGMAMIVTSADAAESRRVTIRVEKSFPCEEDEVLRGRGGLRRPAVRPVSVLATPRLVAAPA